MKAQARARLHVKEVRPIKYEINNLVLVRNHYLSSCMKNEINKFFLLYRGPYKVLGVKLEIAYVLSEIEANEIVGTYNVVVLKRFYPLFKG